MFERVLEAHHVESVKKRKVPLGKGVRTIKFNLDSLRESGIKAEERIGTERWVGYLSPRTLVEGRGDTIENKEFP